MATNVQARVGAVVFALAIATPCAAAPPVRVELLTMGQGADVYSLFGHAALRVRDGDRDLVYNFGYTDFGAPTLIRDVLRGRARFWAVTDDYASTLDAYAGQGRSIFRQTLNLSDAQHAHLARRLADSAVGRRGAYVYHHYRENCATRLRDLIDEAAGGVARAQLVGRLTGDTYRTLTREGLAAAPPLLMLTELVLGRPADAPVDRWAAGFLPRLLRVDLQRVRMPDGRALAEPPDVVQAATIRLATVDRRAGVFVLWLLAVIATSLVVGAGLLARRRARVSGLPLVVLGLLFGALAIVIWVLAFAAELPELAHNELIWLLWPTDLLLVGIGVRWLRKRIHAGRFVRGYAVARVAIVVGAAVAHAVGVLGQQPRVWLLVVGAPMVALRWAFHALPTRPPIAVSDPPVSASTAPDRSPAHP